MEIEALKRIRKSVRRATTEAINSIKTELNDTERISTDLLEELYAKILDKEKQLEQLDKDILKLCKIDDIEKEVEKQQEYKDNIITWKVRANKVINKKESEVKEKQNISSSVVSNPARNEQCSLKLPQLTIPQFNGNILKFDDFYSQFETAIDNNVNLSEVEKFNYLKSYLIEDAEIAIRGLTLKSENYKIAKEIIKERFGRRDIIIDTHMTKLLHLNPVRKSYDILNLRKLYSECETHIRGLENNGVNPNTYTSLLYPILLKAIPRDLSLEFSRKSYGKTENTITDLLQFLKVEIHCREKNEHLTRDLNTYESEYRKETKNYSHEKTTYQKYGKFNKNKNDHTSLKNKNNSHIPTASAFAVDIKKCIFCPEIENNKHSSEKCPLSVEERKLSLRKNGICYLCLKKGKHIFKECKIQKNCSICKRKHSELICENQLPLPSPTDQTESTCSGASHISPSVLSSKVSCSNICSVEEEVLLETCTAKLLNNSRSREINILLDNASQRTFLKKEVGIQLQLPIIRKENLLVYTFGSRSPVLKEYEVVKLTLCNSHDPEKKIAVEALLSDVISGSPFRVSANKIMRALNNKNIQFSNVVNESRDKEISLLIGAQYFWDIHSGKKEKITKTLYSVETIFGKIIQGRLSPIDYCKQDISVFKVECCSALNDDLTRFWNLDSMGINCSENNNSKWDKDFISKFENNLKFNNGMYETKLFWDEKPEDLNNNWGIAKRCFENLCLKMKEGNWVYDEYRNIVKNQLQQGIVEECVTDYERDSYYMPHSAVVRSDKETTRVRMVYNCSSKGKNCKSLNDYLHAGPSLNPKILDVILRFRQFEHAFSSDIQGAFLTIGISEEDRNYLRFFWFPDEGDSKSYKILRMTRVSFGVTSSPFILAATIKYHIRKYKEKLPEVFEMLNSSLYVDDLFFGSDSVDKAFELSRNATEILRDANMNLRKFKTNSKELRELWYDNNISVDIETGERPMKVLGIIWNLDNDTFKLDVEPLIEMIKSLVNTKRYVLKTAAKIYDPVGFVAPFVLIIKILLQEIWEYGLGWDETLPDELNKRWKTWCSQISLLKELTIDRKYFPLPLDQAKELQLHVFSDASLKAFGAVAYFRLVTNDDKVFTRLITAKSRVSPLKKVTLPRLELLGAVLASRIFKYLKTEFNFAITKHFLWTDSLITLHWIKGTASKYKQFVSNRVLEIQSNSDPANWYHCKGCDNPADYVSRGATVENLISSQVWVHGPNWLSETENKWPKNENSELSDISSQQSLEHEEQVVTLLCESQPSPNTVIDLDKFSVLNKLLRVTAYVLRFIHNLKNKNNKKHDELTAEEIDGAEIFWTKIVQQDYFQAEINCLEKKKQIINTSSILEFNPFLDADGRIRIGGRLQKSKFTYGQKHPILLPAKHKYVNLIVIDSHNKVFHNGISETLTEIREKFWILRGRQTVKNILKNCYLCRKYNSKPGVQVTAPMPAVRLEQSPPFSVVGIDFGGPLYVKDSEKKHYIVLFTCGVTRALHLELVDDMSTDTFLMALRRFISRRGLCSKILTDNAKTFKRSELELKNLWSVISNPAVKAFYASHNISWVYIAERASWWGGYYERMIKSVKLALRKVVGKTSLLRTELETLLIEIEGVLNSRPLTYVFSDFGEPIPLTPSHLILGRRINSLPPVKLDFNSNLNNRNLFVKKFNYRERVLNLFWINWSKQYILFLKSLVNVKPTGKCKQFSLNDVVLIYDEKLPRNFWKLGKIVAIFPGRDGNIRSCLVKTATSTIKRPVQLLYNLEVQ